MESPPPAVFHDKAKRTQQGDLLPPIERFLTRGLKKPLQYIVDTGDDAIMT